MWSTISRTYVLNWSLLYLNWSFHLHMILYRIRWIVSIIPFAVSHIWTLVHSNTVFKEVEVQDLKVKIALLQLFLQVIAQVIDQICLSTRTFPFAQLMILHQEIVEKSQLALKYSESMDHMQNVQLAFKLKFLISKAVVLLKTNLWILSLWQFWTLKC